MPSGKVKWYDADKGFGFLSQEGGEDVYVRSEALPAAVSELRPGQRVEFSMAAGRRGPQALKVDVLEPLPTFAGSRDSGAKGGAGKAGGGRAAKPTRSPDELHGLIEDMIQLLELSVQQELRKGKYPDKNASRRVAEVVRAVARELDA